VSIDSFYLRNLIELASLYSELCGDFIHRE